MDWVQKLKNVFGGNHVEELLSKLEEAVELMDIVDNKSIVSAFGLAYKICRGWESENLLLSSWSEVARYNKAFDKIKEFGYSMPLFISLEEAISLNPNLAGKEAEYFEARRALGVEYTIH